MLFPYNETTGQISNLIIQGFLETQRFTYKLNLENCNQT